MPVFRTEKVSDYAVIAKHHLKNRALSYKAKGLLTFMLCVPDDWDFSMAGLATLAGDGIDGVRSGIRELEKHGYLTRRRIRGTDGKLGDIEYTVHEVPQTPQNNEPPKTPTEPSFKSNIPTLEKPILDFPMQLSNKELNINESNNKKLNNKKTKPPCLPVVSANPVGAAQLSLEDSAYLHQQVECLTVKTAQRTGKPSVVLPLAKPAQVSQDFFPAPVNHTKTLAPPGIFPVPVEQQFELFWQLYPRKAGKKAAKKAWGDIKPSESLFSTIMAAIKIADQYWKQQGISLNHIPHPSTWLNEERWEDEFTAEQLTNCNINTHTNRIRGGQSAIIWANYTIGGENDPYRAIIPR
jgi:hypothetical protein